MKNFIFIALLLVSCSTTKSKVQNNNTSEDQIFISNQSEGLPGKCYQKMMTQDSQTKFAQVLCASEITKSVIGQIQTDLIRLGYSLDQSEIENKEFGISTKDAIKQFQQINNLAYGGLDWATINKLKISKLLLSLTLREDGISSSILTESERNIHLRTTL